VVRLSRRMVGMVRPRLETQNRHPMQPTLSAHLHSPATAVAMLTILAFSAPVFAAYFAGLVILAIGSTLALRQGFLRARGIERLICLGPTLYAAPMAVFGSEHLTATRDIASMVPKWIPAHIFWAILVGLALLAAALSIVTKRLHGLAATLLGAMLLTFVLLIHIPLLAANPADRLTQAVVLRDLSFSAGAFALASTVATARWHGAGRLAAAAARCVVGVALVFFSVQHFLHPQFVPVVPLSLQMPAWLPLHWLWSYGTGTALLLAGLAMLANWHARHAAAWMGWVVCAVVALVYLPILASHPASIGVGMNYFADTLAFGGNLLLVASALPQSRSGKAAPATGRPVAVAVPQ
jgi:uncharacterized membrane protein